MLTPPEEIDDALLEDALAAGWSIDVASVSYLPVGFGSHHWSVTGIDGTRWFATVDVVTTDAEASRLTATLDVTRSLRDDGCGFVVAPLATSDSAVVRRLSSGALLALYPDVEGRSGGFDELLADDDAQSLAAMLAALHDVDVDALPVAARSAVGVDDLAIPARAALERALASDRDDVGLPGPYTEDVRALLRTSGPVVTAALKRHDALLAAAGPQDDRLVVTHGEPHPGNLIWSDDGLVLVDWTTLVLAPPERDLWLAAARSSGQAAEAYRRVSGRQLVDVLMQRYELAWTLTDVALFVDQLLSASAETDDDSAAWGYLQASMSTL